MLHDENTIKIKKEESIARANEAAPLTSYQQLYNAIRAAIIANDNPHADIRNGDAMFARNLFIIKKFRHIMESQPHTNDKLIRMITEASQYAAENIVESLPFCCFFSRKIALTSVEKLCKLIADLNFSKQDNASISAFQNKLLETYPAAVNIPKAKI
jgi:hypothetical protein